MAITHDGFFKSLMEEPGAAGALLRERLPPEVVKLLAPGEPELVPGSFIDAELRETRSDRLYRVRAVTGEPAYVYCLVEHKSAPNPRIGMQLLTYLTRIWERHDREAGRKGPLPAVVTLVVYHGADPWTGPRRFSDLLGAPEGVRHHVLDFPIHVVDVGRVDENTLSQHARLGVGLLLLKYATRTEKGDVVETVTALLVKMGALPQEPLERYWRYIADKYEAANRKGLSEALRRTMPDKEEHMMSIAAKEWLAEGEAKGRVEGRVEGRAEGKAETLLRQLKKRFGELPEEHAKAISAAGIPQLDEWLDRILDAASLDEVFGPRTH